MRSILCRAAMICVILCNFASAEDANNTGVAAPKPFPWPKTTPQDAHERDFSLTYDRSDAPDTSTCGLKRVESYHLFPDGYGHALVNFMVDKPRRFLVDTGGIRSSVFSSIAADMKLTPVENEYIREVGVSGDVYKTAVDMPNYTIGVFSFPQAVFVVVPDEDWATKASVAGTLAPRTLMTFDVEFDFAHNAMNLFFPYHCPGKVVYWADQYAAIPFKLNDGHIEIDATLEGRRVTATLDTGAPTTMLSLTTAKRIFGLDGTSEGVSTVGNLRDGDKKDPIYSRYFNQLSVGGIEIKNPRIHLVPDHMSDATHGRAELPQLILGLHELVNLRFYIAYGERMIYVTSAGAGFTQSAAQPTNYKN